MISLEKGFRKEEVYAMWQRNFHDPVPYADFYFNEIYGKNEILLNLLEEDETVMKGMLHLNPYTLHLKGDSVNAHYIVGVATDEEYRRQGVMRELLKESFERLRNHGEAFTYLMPADENYYLPFDFRFGSCQVEQEIECFAPVISDQNEAGYEFQTIEKEKLTEIAQLENQQKDDIFTIHTKITSEYLERLEKEIRSDFGKLLFVYRDGKYTGRFVVGAENDYMVVSQIFCGEQENRETFLYQILNYCEKEYHYGKYQLILDESWLKVLKKPGNYQGIRVLPARKRPIIMFRILNLEMMGKYFPASCEQQGFFRITDGFLKEQEGIYEWKLSGEKSVIQKYEEFQQEPDCGEISIGDLTVFLFGNKKGETLDEITGLTQKGKDLLLQIQPLNLNCIQEIV